MIKKLLLLPMFGALIVSLHSCASHRGSESALHERIMTCESCHSRHTTVPSTAPSLDGMTAEYIVEQLENFRQSKRGFDPTDAFARDMSQQAKALRDEQITLIADYYSSRERQFSNESVSGDAQKGKQAYKAHCEGCHSSILGRYFTKSPRITHLRGTYLLAQLQKFSKGKRLVSDDSQHKLKMVTVAKKLSDSEQSNIVAFIKNYYTD